MKKVLLLAAVVGLLTAPVAFAGQTSGCGVGTQLFKGQSGMVPNLLAVTTNAILPNTFSMTSGTVGCDADATVYNQQRQVEYVAANLGILSEEMAQGQGEHVTALADLMGCPVNLQGDFSRVSQEKYPELFPTADMEANSFLEGLKSEMAKDPVLASGCTRIS